MRLLGLRRLSGSQRRLNSRKASHQLGAEHLGQQRGAGLAVAVFAGERAAVGDDDVGGAVDELAEGEDAGLGLEVEVEAHVDAALAEVAVHGAAVVELAHEGVDGAEIGALLRGIDGGVFPALPAHGLAGDEGGGSEAGLADVPDAVGFVGVVDAAGGFGGKICSASGESAAPAASASACVSAPNSTSRKPRPSGREREVFDELVLFARRESRRWPSMPSRPMGLWVRSWGTWSAAMKMSSKPMPTSVRYCGLFDEAQRGSEDDGAGAFAADEGAGDVEAVFGEKLVEVEAGDAAGDAGKLFADERRRRSRGGA